MHASDDTNALARDKGFPDFRSLLRPYGEVVQGRVTARDSQGLSLNFEEFGVRICSLWDTLDDGSRGGEASLLARQGHGGSAPGGGNLAELERLVEVLVRRGEEVLAARRQETEVQPEEEPGGGGEGGLYDTFLRRLLSRMPTGAHECFTHPVACVVAISSRNPAPIETLRRLYESGNQVPMPSWVSRDYLRYYVLVHDEDRDDLSK